MKQTSSWAVYETGTVVLMFFFADLLGSRHCAHYTMYSIYLPTPDPARQPGIPPPPYTKHVLIWPCCLYGGGELVQFSTKPLCPPSFSYLVCYLSVEYTYIPTVSNGMYWGDPQPIQLSLEKKQNLS